MQPWFRELIGECLRERGFLHVGNEEGQQKSDKCVYSETFHHSTCPGAVFTFLWIEVTDGYVTGSSVWVVGDAKSCTSIDKLSKIHPSKRQSLKMQIIDHLLLPCLYSCQQKIHGFVQEGLIALPYEVLKRICTLLPVTSLRSLAPVHSTLHSVSRDLSLWKDLYKRDFQMKQLSPQLSGPSNGVPTNWRELYKTEYLANRAFSQRPPVVLPLGTGRPYIKYYKQNRDLFDLADMSIRRLVYG